MLLATSNMFKCSNLLKLPQIEMRTKHYLLTLANLLAGHTRYHTVSVSYTVGFMIAMLVNEDDKK